MGDIEFQKVLKEYHKMSDRHILKLSTDMPYSDVLKIVKDADKVRKAGNELVAKMRKNIEQLERTKRYRKLKTLYGNASENKNTKQKKEYARQMTEMQEQYNVTWDFCRKAMQSIGKKYGIGSIFGLTKAEDIWRAVKNYLYSNGKAVHFSKYDELPCLRAKQINRGITLSTRDTVLYCNYNKISIPIRLEDRFEIEETVAMLEYLDNPDAKDTEAVYTLIEEGWCIDTYRPCFVSLVPKMIRGKWRVYAHITLEGKAKPKYKKDGTLRHTLGNGVVGVDIGTQTIAYTSDTEVGLKNLAERGITIRDKERKERLLYRKMERSRRATNPRNYNDDGTIKKDKKKWKFSKRYRKLRARHQELCRKNAENRHLAIREEVNHLRELGHVIVTEPKNANKLKKRAKETTVSDKGRYNRKKRFGRSIQNRNPGYFQEQIKTKFTVTNGLYQEVPNDYRASQYDHTTGDYIKKRLSDRMYALMNGIVVQRDWYSSYLLYCFDYINKCMDKNKCKDRFDVLYQKELKMIEQIKQSGIAVRNSGIKVA